MDYILENANQLVQPLETIEQETVYRALILCRGNVALAAKQLGITGRGLRYKLKRWKENESAQS